MIVRVAAKVMGPHDSRHRDPVNDGYTARLMPSSL
jgi:hypothetical protein